MATLEQEEIADFEVQAREFLLRAQEYLQQGDLHQASEKGWGAAAHMAKAVALSQGWRYETHAEYNVVMSQARQATGNDRIRSLRGIANDLHGNYYRRRRHLNAEEIADDIESVAELLEALSPLVES